MTLGERIQDRRKRLGLDQHELAKRLQVAQSSVCDWEKGNTKPRLDRLADIANVLGVRESELTKWWLAS